MVHEAVGSDAGKKLKGRKRFTLVDTLGLLLMVKVVVADVQEREGAKQLLTQMNQERHRVPRLVRIWAARLGGSFPPKAAFLMGAFLARISFIG
jgi:Transposase DDE domain